mgnify:FL=1
MKSIKFRWPFRPCTLLFICGLIFLSIVAMAQGAAIGSGLEKATSELKTASNSVNKLMLAVCGIIGVVGGINVYSKWSNGDPDTRKSAAAWFGALIFAGLITSVLTAVFGA